MGPNTTGKNNPQDYSIGRGVVYFGTIGSDGKPDEYRDLGNAPEFNLTVDKETLEHFSSREGLKYLDREVTISQRLTISRLVLDELNHENLALLLSGAKASYTNPAIAGFAEIVGFIASVQLGRWYDLTDSTGARVYDIDGANVTLEVGVIPLVEGTDYELDTEMGRVFFLTTATNVTDTDTIDFTLAADAGAKNIDEVRTLSQETIRGALKFVQVNPANANQKLEWQFHRVALKADGDLGLISDEWQQMVFTGAAERNVDADANSPTLTIRSVVES